MAVKIIVKGYFSLQKAMQDKSSVEVEKDSASVRDVLTGLCERFGKDLMELIQPLDGEGPASHLIVLVNGRNALTLPGRLDTPLKDGDEIALFPPMMGG
jgi:MoaD family protein